MRIKEYPELTTANEEDSIVTDGDSGTKRIKIKNLLKNLVKKDDVIEISKGGTGKTTAKGGFDALASGLTSETENYNLNDDDSVLWMHTSSPSNPNSSYKTKIIKLWNYIKSKADSEYLKLSGGTLPINSNIDDSNIGISIYQNNVRKLFFGVEASGNEGLYIDELNDWGILYDGGLKFNGSAKRLQVNLINENTNLNTIMQPGFHRCIFDNIAITLTNCPTSSAFSMIVTLGANSGIYQEIIECKTVNTKRFMRNANVENGILKWGSWYRVYTTADIPTAEDIGAMKLVGKTYTDTNWNILLSENSTYLLVITYFPVTGNINNYACDLYKIAFLSSNSSGNKIQTIGNIFGNLQFRFNNYYLQIINNEDTMAFSGYLYLLSSMSGL